MIVCRLCGARPGNMDGVYLTRVNEKGVPGIWECRPHCHATLTQEEALMAAVAGDERKEKQEDQSK